MKVRAATNDVAASMAYSQLAAALRLTPAESDAVRRAAERVTAAREWRRQGGNAGGFHDTAWDVLDALGVDDRRFCGLASLAVILANESCPPAYEEDVRGARSHKRRVA